MITVLRGTSKELIAHVTTEYATKDNFVIVGCSDFALPFIIIRLIIPLLRNSLGDQKVEETLYKYKVPLSLLFNKLAHDLTIEEKQEQDLITANLSSNISHSKVAKDFILKSYAQVLIELMGKKGFRLVIPDATHLDTGSLDLLTYMYQILPDKSPDLVIGYNPVWEKQIFEKEHGISWYYSLDSDTVLRSFVYAFESVAEVKSDIGKENSVSQDSIITESIIMDERLDVFDDGLELRVYKIIKTHSRPIDGETATLILKCIKKCFRLFDFTNALFFSLRTQKAIDPLISDSDKAAVYHIIGLSAHNRHFFSQGNLALAEFIEKTLQKALFYEIDPAFRIAILYRLIVTLSRRKSELNIAQAYLNQAYQELDENRFKSKDKQLLTAWINNIHSFLLMKQGKMQEAISRHEDGYYLLNKVINTSSGIIKNEIEFTMAVLAENLSTLNSLTGNFTKMKDWYAIESKFSKKWSSLGAVPSAEWQSFYYQNLELKKALEKTHQGLAKAKSSFHYILEYFFTLSLADISYRLGNTNDALTYFQKAFIFQNHIGYSYISAYALNISLIKTEIRLNKYEEAISHLAEMENAFQNESTNDRLEIYILLAYCYALLNLYEDAEEQINKAIDLAVEDGGCGALIRVTLSAGHVCQLLNRKQNAIATYNKALEISKTELEGVLYQPDKSDLADIYIGLYESGEKNTDYLDHAICNLSLSLKRNADSWWSLKRVLLILSSLPLMTRNECLKRNKSAIEIIKKTSQQRSDCQDHLWILKKPLIKPIKAY